jgi:hypothetical protein
LLLKEQINPINKPELNSSFQIQIVVVVAIRSVAQDLEKVETTIALKKAKLKNRKDVQEIDRLLAELKALEWLQGQIAVCSVIGITMKQFLYSRYYCYCSLCGKELKKKFLIELASILWCVCWRCI